jgi:CRP/FNR family transcriptional regulator, cyclic AMP receptor protein
MKGISGRSHESGAGSNTKKLLLGDLQTLTHALGHIFDPGQAGAMGVDVSAANVTPLAVLVRNLKPAPELPMVSTRSADGGRAASVGDSHAPSMSASPASPAHLARRCQVCAAHQSCVIGQLPHAQQERLDPLIRELPFRKGDVLQTEGAQVAGLRTIKLGNVVLTRCGPDSVSRPVAVVGQGHLLDMLPPLGQPSGLGAQALSAGRTCELPASALNGMLAGNDPALLNALHGNFSITLGRLADWGHVMRLRGLPRQLVAAVLLLAREQSTQTVRLPSHVALSELLRTTRESVARTLKRLEARGLLHRIDRWHVSLSPNHHEVFTHSDMDQP